MTRILAEAVLNEESAATDPSPRPATTILLVRSGSPRALQQGCKTKLRAPCLMSKDDVDRLDVFSVTAAWDRIS